MIKQLSTVLFVGTCGFVSACGEDGGRQVEADVIEDLEGFGFVPAALALSDLCAPAQSCKLAENPPLGATLVSIHQPEPGTVCLKGEVGRGGWAILVLSFTDVADGKVVPGRAFDADARGITAASFTLHTPPREGLRLASSVFKPDVDICQATDLGRECRLVDFWLTDPESDEVVTLEGAGEKVVRLDQFVYVDPQVPFDTSKLGGFAFWISETAGPVDYCISDFALLDADGNEVAP